MNFLEMISSPLAYQVVKYVTDVPGFWTSMGMTSATSIFLGATMYNGELKKLMKGLVAVCSYGALMLLVTTTRIGFVTSNLEVVNTMQAHAGMITWYFVTFFYVAGMFIGVLTSKYSRRSIK